MAANNCQITIAGLIEILNITEDFEKSETPERREECLQRAMEWWDNPDNEKYQKVRNEPEVIKMMYEAIKDESKKSEFAVKLWKRMSKDGNDR